MTEAERLLSLLLTIRGIERGDPEWLAMQNAQMAVDQIRARGGLAVVSLSGALDALRAARQLGD